MRGHPTGEITGEITGKTTGGTAGEITGETTREATGGTTREATGGTTGGTTREATGESAGKATGGTTREATGESAGKATGESAGKATSREAGELDAQPMTPAGHRIVAAAEELFYNRGITAVGVDLIAEHSGVTKRTLYNRFGSKDRLVAAYLAERDQRWRSLVRAHVDTRTDPVEAVTAPFDALRTWSETNTRGCSFINALAELPDPAHPAHRVAAHQKLWLRELFEELATAAGCQDPATLAARLLVLHEGALATQPLPLDTLPAATDLARALVRAAAPGGRKGAAGRAG